MISIFGWLDNFNWWTSIPYPTRGALLRAMKAGLSVAVGILVAALAQGILLPPETSPIIVLVVTSVLQAVDKYLREAQIAKENAEAGIIN